MDAIDPPPAHASGAYNPLLSDEPGTWDRLIEGAGPASILCWIRAQMGERALARTSPEDVFQETLLYAYASRARFEWRGHRSFRRWLLAIAVNRLRDALDLLDAAKRGGGDVVPLTNLRADTSFALADAGPIASTTPSRIAIFREEAEAMRAALESLAPELRDVLALRLFEDLSVEEIAARLGLTFPAARHRFRRAAELFARCLARARGSDGTARG